MFGDLGHGFILTLFAAWMVIFEKSLGRKKTNNEIWNIFFGGRYIILLMGLFSMYTGLIYNDIFSRSMNIFGSSWKINYKESTIESNAFLTLNPNGSDYTQTPYPFGVDPVWQLADNKIIFSNSYKMKLSIIIGVIHMIFGVCLSVANYIHNKQSIYILFDFLPQVLFLLLLFFYMVFMMFFKFIKYSATNPLKSSEQCAPSVLIMFINMVLMSKPVDKLPDTPDDEKCDLYMYDGQYMVQLGLLAAALVCIPWMLIAKPVYLISCKRSSHSSPKVMDESLTSRTNLVRESDGEIENGKLPATKKSPEQHSVEEEPPAEIVIHQIIHTIEYVLSTVSHTASYLRLWALSLAHSQLSEVLWKMVLQKMIKVNTFGVGVYLGFGFWSFLTVSILVLMEGLSAFLHTLRLHWVEFCSKFYGGAGYAFTPFSLKKVTEEDEEEA